MSVAVKKSPSLMSQPIFLKETSSETFSANYVIHAYEQGRQRGMHDKIIGLESDAKSQFSKNRDYTVGVVNNLVIDLITDGIIVRRGWIKSDGINDFDAIIGIPQHD